MPRRFASSETESGIYGVVGEDIGYTLSPFIFRQVFDSLQWPAVYAIIDIPGNALQPLLKSAYDARIRGLSVTKPFKQAVVPLMARLDPSAAMLGAVNTIVSTRDGLIGYNTDIAGAKAALWNYRARLRGGRALIFGAGGAARAVAYAALAELKMSQVSIASRARSRAQRLIHDLQDRMPQPHVASAAFRPSSDLAQEVTEAALIVNATPIGSGRHTRQQILPRGTRLDRHTIAFDLVYSPRPTQFTREAQLAGCRTVIDGWPMLVAQAEAAFTLWTGRRFPKLTRQRLLNLKSLPW